MTCIFFLCLFVVLNTFTCPLAYTIAGFDPFRYTLDYILPHPTQRSVPIILISNIIRLFICLLGFLEAFRTITLFIIGSLVITIRFSTGLNTMAVHMISRSEIRRILYLQKLSIIWNNIQVPAETFISLVCTGIFSISIFLVWLCVKDSPQSFGTIVYPWFIINLLVDIGIVFIILKPICCLFDRLTGLFVCIKIRNKFLFLRSPSRSGKISVKKSASLNPVQYKCVMLGPVGMSFLVSFLQSLLLRIFDALLIVEFWLSYNIPFWKQLPIKVSRLNFM